MQKQIVLMEHEIKLLKDREVDQKNKASGYETLLRDGIPLNEHFLALKNKFNNEKDDLEKFVKTLEDEIKRQEMNNKSKKNLIEIRKGEYNELNYMLTQSKDEGTKTIRDMETRLFNEKHTKAVLDNERQVVSKKLMDIKTDNQDMSRKIQKEKMYNKKDDDRKAKKETQDKQKTIIADQNKEIEDHDIQLDKEKRKLDDVNLPKK
mmetsp:Transcript_29629/g.28851  ORF Transcript_29629/g.28851 Transcript_29629/m.28851 type:complete len:206 (+) Transcript_29629:260-877(+)